ncbi:hypothetical protein E4T47_01785 [Aureobasidium subglaciale]|nr:hypothetical protein E4T47_01785 [Aureobasidium subglaciale]
MLATRLRTPLVSRLPPLARPSTAARRFFADQQTTPNSPLPQTAPPTSPAAVPNTPITTPTTQPTPTPTPTASPDVIPIPRTQRPPRLQDGYSGAFYLTLLGGLLLSAPVISYFYWQHRKTHMREKKEAILSEIHARVGRP